MGDIKGRVLVRKSNAQNPAGVTEKTALGTGDVLVTEKGSCTLFLESNTHITLGPGTSLLINEASKSRLENTRFTVLNLQMGRLQAKVGKLVAGSRFEVRTPQALAAVRGTFFNVYTGGGHTDLCVFAEVDSNGVITGGSVFFRNSNSGVSFPVDFGHLASMLGDGSSISPQPVTAGEQEKLQKEFNEANNNAAQQGGVEEESTGGDSAGGTDTAGDTGDDTDDSDATDRRNEQNVSGNNALQQQAAQLLANFARNFLAVFALREDLVRSFDNFHKLVQGIDERVTPGELLEKIKGHTLFGSPADEWTYASVSGDNADKGLVTSERKPLKAIVADLPEDLSLDKLQDRDADLEGLKNQMEDTLAAAARNLINDSQLVTAQAIKDRYGVSLEEAEQIRRDYDQLRRTGRDVEALRERERAQMREVLNEIRGDEDFRSHDAGCARTEDIQTGKVFTDIHGFRVRVDQYVFQDSPDSVRFLSLTLRTDGPLAGISYAAFGVDFNEAIECRFRDLPWNDYFNVVTREDMAEKLGIPRFIEGEEGPQDNPEYDALFDQYVVHEHQPELADNFYPEHFWAEFANPAHGEDNARDKVRFDEAYSEPFELEFEGQSSPEEVYVVQGQTANSTWIRPAQGDSILLIYRRHHDCVDLFVNASLRFGNDDHDHGDGHDGDDEDDHDHGNDKTLFADLGENGEEIDSYVHVNFEGAQTPGFADGYVPGDLLDFNLLSDDGGEDEDESGLPKEHPAFFAEGVGILDRDSDEISAKALIGIFVPFDNQGRPLNSDAEDGGGYGPRGLRDLLSPNPHVNGGNYNLEVIFSFGDVDFGDVDWDDIQSEDIDLRDVRFTENFRIDTVITPEIFSAPGFNTANNAVEFPARLRGEDREGEDDFDLHFCDSRWRD